VSLFSESSEAKGYFSVLKSLDKWKSRNETDFIYHVHSWSLAGKPVPNNGENGWTENQG